MKKFFYINEPYRFEWNDLRALLQVVNLVLILTFGVHMAWIGLALAVFGVCKDLSQKRHINDLVLHLSSTILNIYLLTLPC
jgi:hypothetical protein